MNEWPNEDLVARHQREIAPLLKNRHLFAESTNFVLYDFWNDHGTVDENVFAYSNRFGTAERALILYNNALREHPRHHPPLRRLRWTRAPASSTAAASSDALALPTDDAVFLA